MRGNGEPTFIFENMSTIARELQGKRGSVGEHYEGLFKCHMNECAVVMWLLRLTGWRRMSMCTFPSGCHTFSRPLAVPEGLDRWV